MKEKQPLIGIAVIVKNSRGQILLGKRLTMPGKGTWQLTGGRLDWGETFASCAIRETKEETGMDVINPRVLDVENYVYSNAEYHVVPVFVGVTTDDEPQVLEPHKCQTWQWFDRNNLPSPLFEPLQQAMDR